MVEEEKGPFPLPLIFYVKYPAEHALKLKIINRLSNQMILIKLVQRLNPLSVKKILTKC